MVTAFKFELGQVGSGGVIEFGCGDAEFRWKSTYSRFMLNWKICCLRFVTAKP